MITEEIYLGEYSNIDELEDAISWYWSGSRFDSYSGCWRKGQHRYDDGYESREGVRHPLVGGKALHSALAWFYAHGGRNAANFSDLEESTLQVLRDSIEAQGGLPLLPHDHKCHHLTPGHFEIILKYYFKWARMHDSIKPILCTPDDLDLSRVVGARWRMTDSGLIMLGESALVMRLNVETPWGEREYLYAGVPDLPVEMANSFYVMDHKSTGMNLGSWYFGQFRYDNTQRMYCVMLRYLLKQFENPLHGILINGITTQKNASTAKFTGTRFMRYGPLDFSPTQLKEAMINQAAFIEMRNLCLELGYFPQIPGFACGNCDFKGLCGTDPALRTVKLMTEYQRRDAGHLLKTTEEQENE